MFLFYKLDCSLWRLNNFENVKNDSSYFCPKKIEVKLVYVDSEHHSADLLWKTEQMCKEEFWHWRFFGVILSTEQL